MTTQPLSLQLFPLAPFALFEDALAPADAAASWLFTDLRECCEVRAGAAFAEDFQAACAAAESAAAGGCYVACYLPYELGLALELATQGPAGLAAGTLLARFLIFAAGRQLRGDAVGAWLAEQEANGRKASGQANGQESGQAVGSAAPGPAGIAELRPALDAAQHAAAVGRIRDYIAAGDCYQVNFTFPLDGIAYGSPLALYARLRQRQPTRHAALLADGETVSLSLSPELFLARQGERLLTRPMKGTAPRGATPAADAANRAALLASPKERAENLMIVDLLRNDLGRVARTGSVRVDALFDAEAYPTVWQLTSSISAAAPGVPLAALLRALFPCGSVTGAPKVRAMQIIDQLENGPRGIYTGSLGWLLPGGDFSLNVAIRTLSVAADGRMRMSVGGGIVADSEAAAEYRECLLKAQFLTGLDPGLRLIETLRLADGVFPSLAGHLARLQSSAAALGFACDAAAVRSRLLALAQEKPGGAWRVRLTLGHGGDIDLVAAALDHSLDAHPSAPQRLLLAAPRLRSDDYLLRHKTTARAVYDAELAKAMANSAFDALFLNERGEVCEGARSNIFVRRGECWLTPALACGVLPGVLRGELLASGAAVEAVLTLADLVDAAAGQHLYCGNALRGLLPVNLSLDP